MNHKLKFCVLQQKQVILFICEKYLIFFFKINLCILFFFILNFLDAYKSSMRNKPKSHWPPKSTKINYPARKGVQRNT